MAKRSVEHLNDDPLDRALSHREVGLERHSLAELGFHPNNRGQLGISSTHVHEVAWSCFGGIKLYRYKQVDVVRVPESALKEFRDANEKKCTADALMPKFSPTMKLAIATKTHFVHANKLRADGSRTLMNDNKTPIVGKTNDEGSEERKILEEGVLCSVYSAKLWDDPAALDALMAADNDDADVEMGEDEIQALGRVETAVRALEAEGKKLSTDDVLTQMQRVGLRNYSVEQTRAFIDFRLALTEPIAKAFRTLVFASVTGRVSVQPADYKAIAGLDVRAMWSKVGILISHYMTTYYAKWPPGSVVFSGPYTGRTTATAPKLQAGCLKELAVEGATLVKLDKVVTKWIRHYVIQNPSVDKVMLARRDLFSQIGKLALKVGSALEKETLKAAAQLKQVKPEERARTTEGVLKGQFAEIEHKYRTALEDAGAFTADTLPAALFPKETKDKGKEEKGSAPAAPTSVAALSQASDGTVLITVEWVMQRLRLDIATGKVRMTNLSFLQQPPGAIGEKAAQPFNGASSSSTGATGGAPDLYQATLTKLEVVGRRYFPSGVKATIFYGGREYEVDSDLLQPEVEKAPPPVVVPAEVTILPPFEWDNMVVATTRRVASFALDEAFIMAFNSTKGIEIEKVGEKEKDFPCILRARATRPFNVGECVLVPFCTQDFDGALANAKEIGTIKKYQEPDLSLMSKNSINRCFLKVISKETKKRKADAAEQQQQVVSETYWAHSPLFFLRKSGEHAPRDLSPLWAVSRTAASKEVNMKFETIVYDINSILPIGKKMPNPSKTALWTVAMQVLTNTKKIAAKDLLHVSVMRVEDEDDE